MVSVHYVADVKDIPIGEHKLVEVQGKSVGVYNVHGEFYALLNYCPHQGAPVCKGKVCGTNLPSDVRQYQFGKEGEILRCPWHGWEFDIKTGKSLFSDKVRTRTYPVKVDEGKIGIVIKK